MYTNSIVRGVKEIIDDVLADVKTPPPSLPNLDDPETCQHEFEERNAKYNFYYTAEVVELWHNLRVEICEELFIKHEGVYWDLNIDYLADLIDDIKDEIRKDCFRRRFKDVFRLSRVRPIDR